MLVGFAIFTKQTNIPSPEELWSVLRFSHLALLKSKLKGIRLVNICERETDDGKEHEE